MSGRRLAIMLLLAGLVATVPLISPQTTGAYWRESLTVTLPDARSDAFGVTIDDATTTLDHSQRTEDRVANEPVVSLTNHSQRHASWIDVVSTRVTIPPSNTTNTLLADVNLDYAVSSNCVAGLTDPVYWDVHGGVGGVTAGTLYPRVSEPISGAELTPGETRSVCPWVRPNYDTSTVAGRRDFLFKHAGRQLDIATTVRQKSFGAGTWTSNQPPAVTSRYQVKLPPPTRRASDNWVCARTLSGGAWSAVGLYGRLYWAWPFAAHGEKSATGGSTAIDRFELIRSTDNGATWTPFRKSIDQTSGAIYTTDGGPSGTKRLSESINSDHLNHNTAAPVHLSVRAFPYPAPSPVHVDADWMVEVSEGYSAGADYFSCRSGGPQPGRSQGVPNPNSEPVGLD